MNAMRHRYSIGRRLGWSFAALSVMGLGLMCITVFMVMRLSLEQRDLAEIESKQALIKHVLDVNAADAGDATLAHRLDDVLIGHEDFQLSLFDAEGKMFYRSHQLADSRARRIERRFRVDAEGAREQPIDALLIMDLEGDRRLLGGLAIALVGATLVGSALIAFAGFAIVRWGLRPLHELATQTASLQPEQLDQRLVLPGEAEELQPWIDQFNQLLNRLQAAYRQLEAFNADVAHELRTPLATLISRGEVDLSLPRSAEQLRESIELGLEDLQRLSTIVNDMLFLSRADMGAEARRDPPASVADQLKQVAEFHEAALEEAGVSIRVQGDARFAFDRGLIRRALSNLVSNATRFADRGSVITIDVVELPDGRIELSVVNQGPSIAPDHLPKLFDRFYRIESARDRRDHHYGLGLAIVAAIARMHGGAPLSRSKDGRTAVGITLPAR